MGRLKLLEFSQWAELALIAELEETRSLERAFRS
jgi:hypothetical protein